MLGGSGNLGRIQAFLLHAPEKAGVTQRQQRDVGGLASIQFLRSMN